jgi:hypothetical protein
MMVLRSLRDLDATFSFVSQPSPILRIAVAAIGLAARRCMQQESSPAAAQRSAGAGHDHRLHGDWRKRCRRRRFERRLRAVYRLPGGMGYVPVSVRALKAQYFTVKLLNLGIPTAVDRTGFAAIGVQYGRQIFGTSWRRNAVRADRLDRDDGVRGVNDVITIVSAIGAGAGGGNAQATSTRR